VDPISKVAPLTSYYVVPPTGAAHVEQWREKNPREFDGFRYFLLGVEAPTLPAAAWGWEYQGTLRLAVLHLIIVHPDWAFQATATLFPDGPESLLRRLSADPSAAEWRAARQAWRILRTFRQERRGHPSKKDKFPTAASFERALKHFFARLHGQGYQSIHDWPETKIAEKLPAAYPTYKAARDTHGWSAERIRAAYDHYHAREIAKRAPK
jgi:hypothetical protein